MGGCRRVWNPEPWQMQRHVLRLIGVIAAASADRRAASAVEYALIAGLIVVVIIGGVRALGGSILSNFYGPIASALT